LFFTLGSHELNPAGTVLTLGAPSLNRFLIQGWETTKINRAGVLDPGDQFKPR
jgi:hypothetical protein